MRIRKQIPLCIRSADGVLSLFLGCIAITIATWACSSSVDAQHAALRHVVSPRAVGTGSSQTNLGIPAFHNTFWQLKYLDSVNGSISDARIFIIPGLGTDKEERGTIVFSTPTYWASFGYYHDANVLKFFPADGHEFTSNKEVGRVFENQLVKSDKYELEGGLLTLEDKARKPLIILSPLQQKGVENQRWLIVKYRSHKDSTDHNGELIESKEHADIIFMNGHVFGSPGMGQWVGTYAVSGNALSSDVGFTFAGIPSVEQAKQTRMAVKALNGVRRIEQDGDRIQLLDRDDDVMLVLEPAA